MLYQEIAKYRMQDRMREAERARIAGEVVANRKRNGKRPQRTPTSKAARPWGGCC